MFQSGTMSAPRPDMVSFSLSMRQLFDFPETRRVGKEVFVSPIEGVRTSEFPGRNVFGVSAGSRSRSGFWPSRGNAFPDQSYDLRSEEHKSELQSLMRTSYAVF